MLKFIKSQFQLIMEMECIRQSSHSMLTSLAQNDVKLVQNEACEVHFHVLP